MKRLLLTLTAIGLLCVPGWAQSHSGSEPDKVEIFGGYSYLNSDFNFPEFAGDHLNGWEASVTGKINRWVGITADISGHYGSSVPVGPAPGTFTSETPYMYSVLFGPQVSWVNRSRFTPYAHVLVGFEKAKVGVVTPGFFGTASDTAFGLALGGGVDVGLTRHLAIRAAQVDWLRTTLFDQTQNAPRVSTGVVFKF